MDRARVTALRERPFAARIACATDFSADGTAAFVHALAIAVAQGDETRLAILNASSDRAGSVSWERFPSVRDTLAGWGRIDRDAAGLTIREALDIVVSKVALANGDPLDLLTAHLANHPVDLLVLGTEGRTGLPRWLHPSFAERLARRSEAMSLFVHRDSAGFIDGARGELRLNRIVLPVDHAPVAQLAVEQAIRLTALVDQPAIELIVLHVGAQAPPLDLPSCFEFATYVELREGPVAREILAAARDRPTDLIIMPTAGHDGLLDALRGSVTEQVLREAPCPVLAIPASPELSL